ncbi:predicted protein [Nematostella vectensis]|uniref:ADP-ribosylation factor-binding protein GGA1 n=1 Tax=Nematostella vectensis TaxID=45351 RepID=A7RUG6_NEMVE|nr:ADP-ribosylation factor-binding protein GGA1 [Nematostella vectensis]EDO44900.1 predicted protein [Nematostella vectensis]|eukprot:XP_001636963.1 predicted protein [Nematostella vectensis]
MEETVESLIDRAVDPAKTQDSSEYFIAVWDKVNKTTDGPQVATRYLAQKVRSVNERESLVALELIEACVKNCGQKFHQEIGKYKFLNELIKLLSAKYDGQWTAPSVKSRIIELLYSWTKGLPKETKIMDAYKMLKTQGVVAKDPIDPYLFAYEETQAKRPPRQDTIFEEDEEKSKLLARLLKSKHPEDLQAANRLIKTMVRQDEIKNEKAAKRTQDIEMSCNNAKLLMDMLNHYQPSSPNQDKELMKELYSSCEKMRPTLFRLASAATEEGDAGLAEILRANDELTRVIDEYRKKVGVSESSPAPEVPGTSSLPPSQPQATADPTGSSLIDLGLTSDSPTKEQGLSSVLENELLALGLQDAPAQTMATSQGLPSSVSQNTSQNSWNFPGYSLPSYSQATSTVGMVRPVSSMPHQMSGGGAYPGGMYQTPRGYGPDMRMPQVPGLMQQNVPIGMGHLGPRGVAPVQPSGINQSPASRPTPPPNKRGTEALKTPTTSLDLLGQEFLQNQKQQQKHKQVVLPLPPASATPPPSSDGALLDLGLDPVPSAPTQAPTPTPAAPTHAPPAPMTNGADLAIPQMQVAGEPVGLDNVFVPLDSVLPGDHAPLTVLDKKGIRMIFHFAKTTTDLSRSDVIIVVISTTSSLKSAVKGFVVQAAVPKSMRVKLQPPSGSDLPPYNPILPASAITQVMLIANPTKEKVRLKFKVMYEVDGATAVETGEVDNFPLS